MDYRPHVPPPPPPRRAHDSPSRQPTYLSPGSFSQSKSPSPTDSGGILGSQEFKDELKVQQSRLSPTQNSLLTIDEKIQLNKQNRPGQGATASRRRPSNENALSQQQLPESLLKTSTLQRDKRPFAYSPDVSDPKNRGKLDLSHIKSPTMRRRLQANMESSDDDEVEEGKEQEQQEWISRTEHEVSQTRSAHNDRPEAQQLQHRQQQGPVLKTFSPPLRQQPPPQRLDNATPTIQYSAGPPTLHNTTGGATMTTTTTSNYIIHVPEPVRGSQRLNRNSQDLTVAPDSLTELNNEIADSLRSLSLLANNLDKSVKQCNRSLADQGPQHYVDNNNKNRSHYSHVSHNGDADQLLRHAPPPTARVAQQLQQQQPASRVPLELSTFSPTGTFARRQQPSFYSVLPSGRQPASHQAQSDYWASQGYQAPTVADSVNSYHYVQPTTATTLQPPRARQPDVNSHTSRGTFYTTADSMTTNNLDNRRPHHRPTTDPYGTMPRDREQPRDDAYEHQRAGRPTYPDHSQYMWTPGPHQPPIFGAWPGTGDAPDRSDQVTALREMTAQLEREVCRLHGLRPSAGR